jgi:gas vesicle protein
MSNNSTSTFASVILGIASGVIAGVLLAPRKGSETRQEISNTLIDILDKTKDAGNTLTTRVSATLQNSTPEAVQSKEIVETLSEKYGDKVQSASS